MVDKSSLAALFCFLPAACLSGDAAAPEPSPREAAGEWEWVWVAGFPNPSLSPEGERAMWLLGDALDREGIRWVAAGSRGFSLNVDSRDLPRGRAIVKEVAERYGLADLDKRNGQD